MQTEHLDTFIVQQPNELNIDNKAYFGVSGHLVLYVKITLIRHIFKLFNKKSEAGSEGFEPSAHRLRADCST